MQSFYDHLCYMRKKLESMDESKRDLIADTFLSDEEIVHTVLANVGDPGITALLLHGSRVDGRSTGKSDYDLIIFNEIEQKEHGSFVSNGAHFSYNYISPPLVEADHDAAYLRFFYPNRVLYDKDGSGHLLKKRIDDCCQNYRTEENKQQYKTYLEELIERMRRHDEDEAFYKALFIFFAPILLVEYNGQISLSSKRDVAILLRDDPELADLFGKMLLPESGVEEAERFYQTAFYRKVALNTKDPYCFDIPKLDDVIISDHSGNTYRLGSCLRCVCDSMRAFVRFSILCNKDYPEMYRLLKTFDPDTCRLLLERCKVKP